MIDGHPVVWLWLVTLMVALASDDVGVLPLAAHAAGLGIAGLATRGPRSASFLAGSAAALGAVRAGGHASFEHRAHLHLFRDDVGDPDPKTI